MKTLKLLLFSFLLFPILSAAQAPTQNIQPGIPSNTLQNDSLVRGVSFAYFKNSVKDFKESAQKALLDTSWLLWKQEKWKTLDTFFSVHNLNHGLPPNWGATNMEIVILDSGMFIDRFGGYYSTPDSVFHDTGYFVSPPYVELSQRSMDKNKVYPNRRYYQIKKPILKVEKGTVIPWSGQPGLGIQLILPARIDTLKKYGSIVEVDSITANKPKIPRTSQ